MKAQAFNYYMHDGPSAFSIELAGALTAEDAKRLEQDWLSASAVIGNKELVVDLSFVTEIDPAGRQLLLRWRRNGATILANTPESRALAESVIGRLRRLARIAYTSQPYRPFLRDVLKLNAEQRNFRLFGPDETVSNGLEAVFEVAKRQWMAETTADDEHLAPRGQVLEVLSEHQ